MAPPLTIATAFAPRQPRSRPHRRMVKMLLTSIALGAAGLILAACNWWEQSAASDLGGSADHGKALIAERGCGGCHLIPKIAGANGNVGPPLLHIATRVYIAGYLRNSPDNMATWLQDPQKVLPGNAMPSMGLSQQDARDITAYLYTLK